jgi:hypothetical protein
LADLYAKKGPLTDDELMEAATAVEATGEREWALAEAERETGKALTIVEELPLTVTVREDMLVVTRMLCGRDC